jgi:hypothetical protein
LMPSSIEQRGVFILVPTSIEQGGIFILPYLLWRGASDFCYLIQRTAPFSCLLWQMPLRAYSNVGLYRVYILLFFQIARIYEWPITQTLNWVPSLLIDWLFTILNPTQEFFWLYGDVTIAGEGLQNLGLCLVLRAFEQGGIFIVPHTLWHGTLVFPVSSEGPPHLVASYNTRGDVEDLF